MANKIQLRRDTASNWTSTNPTLSQGEQGYETDTGKFKIGNGTTAWTSLAYSIGYTDASVNAHLNTSTATSGEVLSWTGSDYDWIAQSGGNVTLTGTQTLTNKTLTSPVLGGTTSSASGNIVLDPATQILEIKGNGSSEEGQIKLNCHANSHGQTLKSQPHSENVTNTMLLPKGANSTLVSEATINALTDTHLNTNTATSSEVLSWTGSDYDWVAQSGGGGAALYAAETTGSTNPTATGTLGLAIGSGATASGGSSVAIGKTSIAAGSEAVALGIARAGNASSLAIQIGTNSSSYGAFGNNGHAVGMLTQVNGTGFAFGRTAISSGGGGALALGMDTTSSGSGAITLGRAVTASHTDAVVIGSGASSSANDQITLGHTDQTVRISSSYTLPSVDGTAGQVLTTDGSGNVSWVTP